MQRAESEKATNQKIGPFAASAVFIILSVIWAFALGRGDPVRTSLALATLTCSIGVGSLIGFVVTIFGDELETLGKARDSVIALLGGITGVGVAKTAEFGGLLGRIQLFPQQSEAGSWFSVLFVCTYTISGFYAMYFLRKLALNPAIADAHERLELRTKLSNRASEVLIEIEKKLPRSILSGHDTIEDEDAQDDESKALKAALLGAEVNEFLVICEDEVAKGTLSIDLISKASVLHYYRIRFLPADSSERKGEIEKSLEWLTRATLMDPLAPEPQLKLAEVYGLSDEDAACLSILERLDHDDAAPQYLDQWLGFYLLFADGREEDAIKHTLDYLKKFPESNEACLLNLSRAYAQMGKREMNSAEDESGLRAEYRVNALDYLRRAVRLDPGVKAVARKLASPNNSFEALANDPDFLEVVAEKGAGSS